MGNKFCELPGLAPARAAMGLTQDELASKMEVNKITILRWEKGHTEPSLGDLRRLATLLNTTVPYLLSGPSAQAS